MSKSWHNKLFKGVPCMEFHLWKSKAIFILRRALPLENLKVYLKLLKGHQGQDQMQRRPCNGLRCVRVIPDLESLVIEMGLVNYVNKSGGKIHIALSHFVELPNGNNSETKCFAIFSFIKILKQVHWPVLDLSWPFSKTRLWLLAVATSLCLSV